MRKQMAQVNLEIVLRPFFPDKQGFPSCAPPKPGRLHLGRRNAAWTENDLCDVLGSWTGVPWEDADEEPVQDADDL